MKREQAELLINDSHYLLGKQVNVKHYNSKTRSYEAVKGTVKSFGAYTMNNPQSPSAIFEVWANIQVDGKSMIKVRLADVYVKYPPETYLDHYSEEVQKRKK